MIIASKRRGAGDSKIWILTIVLNFQIGVPNCLTMGIYEITVENIPVNVPFVDHTPSREDRTRAM